MPARHLKRATGKGAYCHIYNSSFEHKKIFADQEDYIVFMAFLKDYLSPPSHLENKKQDFTVKGKTFRGMPHLPKNYHGQVELIAYALDSDHFHLLLKQNAEKSIAQFIRSLCTRYSMYFNKKYKRSGSLFHGPYKSVEINNETDLIALAIYINNHAGNYTSRAEYQDTGNALWIKPLENLAEKEKEIETDKSLPKELTLEPETRLLERSEKVKDLTRPTLEPQNISTHIPQSQAQIPAENFVREKRVPELMTATGILIILLTLGVRNINAYNTGSQVLETSDILGAFTTITATPSPSPPALEEADVPPVSEATPEPTPSPTAKPEAPRMVVITITDNSPSVNLRQKPDVMSENIGTAIDGDIFELVSSFEGWYEVKLPEGNTGFISAKYAQSTDLF